MITAFEKYFTEILDGKIIACEKMKRISSNLLEDFANPKEFHFDIKIANKHINFIEKFCKVPSGAKAGTLSLELFQKARLQAIFGFVDDNNLRKYNECLIIEGRKNGKTTETAAVNLDLLINDKEFSPQIYNVATMLEQAKLGFNASHKMVKQSPLLRKHVVKRASDLYFSFNMGFIKALASNTSNLDGLDIHGATIDELAAIKNRDIYDLTKQAMSARLQPLLFCITTNGFVRNGIFDSQYEYAKNVIDGSVKNKRFLPFIYELDSIDEWQNPNCWIKANPGLGTIKSYEYLENMVQKAKDDESTLPTVLVKDFNMKQTNESAWLRYEELNYQRTWKVLNEYKFDYGIASFDAAETTDLAAARVLCQRPGDEKYYTKSMYWLPESVIETDLAKGNRRERDDVPFQLWIKKGYLRTVPGNRVDKKVFLDWLIELRDEEELYITYIAYDPWHVDDSLKREFELEFGKKSMIEIRQGAKTLSDPMKNLKADLQAKKINYDNNPVDKWCLLNTEIKTDINGNIQPIKSKQNQRIDGTITLICAYIVANDKRDLYINLNKEK